MTRQPADFEYYLNDSLSKKAKERLHQQEMEDLRTDYFRPFVGLVVKESAIGHLAEVQYAINHCYLRQNPGFIKLFVSVLYPFLEDGLPDKLKHYKLKVHLSDANAIIDIPFSAIMNDWRTGWPRDGRDPRYYTYFPWKVLRPLYHYLHDQINSKQLKNDVYTHYDNIPMDMRDYYYQTVLPYIQTTTDHEPIFRETVRLHYDKLYQLLTDTMSHYHSLPNSGYIYVGVFPSDVTLDHFLPDTSEENPLIELEMEYLSKMNIRRKAR